MNRAVHFTVVATAALLLATPVAAAATETALEPRNFDARITRNEGFVSAPSAEQQDALDALRQSIPELAVTFDRSLGVTRSVYNPTGYLTDRPSALASALEVALDYVEANAVLLGLSPSDLEHEVADQVYSKATGATRFYLRQLHQGLPVYNGLLQVNVNRDHRILSVNNAFVSDLRGAVREPKKTIALDQAVASAARHAGIALPERAAIEGHQMWLPIRAGEVRSVWNFQIQTPDSQHWFDFTVDAEDGRVWTRFDWVSSGTYRVYQQPVESPNHTTPVPPADARTLAVNPEDATASPNGWFAGGTMDGNNVHACLDAVSNNVCDSPQPSCSGTTCDFSINLGGAPSTYTSAAITNLFYWNNVIHDIQYQYGFDEAAGNFQENNFGNGGAGSDSVNADAQDGGGNCNANFATPTDGGNPRMQMYTCTNTSPTRDGDLDNAVIVHEYGHGISIRQVGGPGNSSCLNNNQQAGEGWSDWLAMAYTGEVGDQGADKRGMGTYLFGQPADGDGIRPQPYSTDPAINNYTYESINGLAIPHGVGSVWAQAIWEVYWTLVDQHGFDPNLYNGSGTAGNQRAMLYINEGLKNTACSPTFVNNRDGIIQAANDNHSGEDVCRIWEAFAAFGLGVDAVSGGSNSTNPTNGFALPAACASPPPVPICGAGVIDFNSFGTESYSNQDASANVSVTDGGDTLLLEDNTWRRSLQSFAVTADTVVEFQFASRAQGEIHAIGFDEDQTLNNDPRHFQFWGTQNWTGTGKIDFNPKYNGSGDFQTFSIPVGATYTGASMRLAFTNDNDAGSGNESRFACVRVFEPGGGNTPPTVTINSPADGSSFTQGTNVTFVGTATDAEDGTISGSIAWSSSVNGSLGSGASVSTSALSVGLHTITAAVTDSGGLSDSDAINITITAPPGSCLHDVDFESGAGGWAASGASTCTTGSFVVGSPDATAWQLGGGNPGSAFFTQPNAGGIGTDDVDGGTCEALSPVVNASAEGAVEVSLDYYHGQRDAGDDASDGFTIEVLNNGSVVDTLVSIGDVTNNPAWTTVSTTVNNPGNIQLRVRASDAAGPGDIVEAGIDNASVCPATPSACTVEDDFESGTAGWFNDGASTCSTGAYVATNPTLQTNSGVTTQVGGSNSGVTSIFTATNTSAGVNDVDGGNCILGSPSWSVANPSTLSVAYFHGQRDAGDDASGDFFLLEYSTNGGSSWSTLASNGDSTSNAAWNTAATSIPGGSNVQLRVQCSDGSGPGDLVECGIDDVSICDN